MVNCTIGAIMQALARDTQQDSENKRGGDGEDLTTSEVISAMCQDRYRLGALRRSWRDPAGQSLQGSSDRSRSAARGRTPRIGYTAGSKARHSGVLPAPHRTADGSRKRDRYGMPTGRTARGISVVPHGGVCVYVPNIEPQDPRGPRGETSPDRREPRILGLHNPSFHQNSRRNR